MTTINLNNLHGMPTEFLDKLQKFNSLFMGSLYMEKLLSNSHISSLIQEINNYCLKNQVYGYHYTRVIPNEIYKAGLICKTGDDIRNSFLTNFGHIFTEEELAKIKKAWLSHFKLQQKESRDSRLFFNFTTSALEELSAEPLLSNFGGEQVYMPIQDIKEIGSKIKSIGKPLILKCKLDPNKIETFYERPWGRIAVSTYHCQINQDAHREDQDGYQFADVKPENIEIFEYDGEKQYSI